MRLWQRKVLEERINVSLFQYDALQIYWDIKLARNSESCSSNSVESDIVQKIHVGEEHIVNGLLLPSLTL